ncbi:MAG: Gfo/Idh/MocA family oxidoreductase [Candidatus Eremiobacteraeota bacterium]|nr:Gfo/Idh/MocA family oxidoreductase [Candidatus Eremiobacteraeota bacterium]
MNGDGSRPLRAGLYGAGAFGDFVLQAVAPSSAVGFSAVASRTKAHAESLAQAQDLDRVHPFFSSLVEDPDIDLVVIAIPPAEHAAQAEAALAAGKHVMVEKPLATTVEDAQRLVAAAASRNLILAVNHPMLYTPLIEGLMLFNASRLVGPLLRISVENIASCEGLGDDHWFWDRRLSGGIFVEHGVHFFDWCGRLAGDPKQAIALTVTHGRREDQVFAALQHDTGAITCHHHSFVATKATERTRTTVSYEGVDIILDGWIPTRMHMIGASAALATTTMRRMLDRRVESIPDARIGFFFDAGPKEERYADAVRAAFEDVARAIREPGHVPRSAAANILPSIRMACAARDAAASGIAVAIDATKTAARP